jgi:flagellar protein FliO/FliZ
MPTVADAWPALLLLGAIIAAPWAVTWVRRSGWQGSGKPSEQALKVLAAVAVGPQQRVVALEVVNGTQRTCLVLGVTAHTITRLDSLPLGTESPSPDLNAPATPPFTQVLSQHQGAES